MRVSKEDVNMNIIENNKEEILLGGEFDERFE